MGKVAVPAMVPGSATTWALLAVIGGAVGVATTIALVRAGRKRKRRKVARSQNVE